MPVMPDRDEDHHMDPTGPTPPGVPEKYFGPDEYLIHLCRPHVVVLEFPAVVCLVTGFLFLAAPTAPGGPEAVVRAIAFVALVAGSGFLARNVAGWWMKRYVLTNFHILVIEGVLSRRVTRLPLRMVIDTSYHRTLMGRLLGYGDLELNLSGQPSLRTLTTLPRPDEMHHSIVYLLGPGGAT